MNTKEHYLVSGNDLAMLRSAVSILIENYKEIAEKNKGNSFEELFNGYVKQYESVKNNTEFKKLNVLSIANEEIVTLG